MEMPMIVVSNEIQMNNYVKVYINNVESNVNQLLTDSWN